MSETDSKKMKIFLFQATTPSSTIPFRVLSSAYELWEESLAKARVTEHADDEPTVPSTKTTTTITVPPQTPRRPEPVQPDYIDYEEPSGRHNKVRTQLRRK